MTLGNAENAAAKSANRKPKPIGRFFSFKNGRIFLILDSLTYWNILEIIPRVDLNY